MPKLAAGTNLPACLRAELNPRRAPVLHYAVVFLVIALIAAVLGFGGIAAGAASVAKLLFFVFAVLAAAAFVVSLKRKS
jgi:uncharacterized membrane protein YtjA (UPF0391 family)